MATLKDVAKLAHCDISTVSRALNNSAPVHPETRARIMAAVKELGYKPNMIAKSLKMGRRKLSSSTPRRMPLQRQSVLLI